MYINHDIKFQVWLYIFVISGCINRYKIKRLYIVLSKIVARKLFLKGKSILQEMSIYMNGGLSKKSAAKFFFFVLNLYAFLKFSAVL